MDIMSEIRNQNCIEKNPLQVLNVFSKELSIAETHLKLVQTIVSALQNIQDDKLDRKIESYLIFAFQAHSAICLSSISKLLDNPKDSRSYSLGQFCCTDEHKTRLNSIYSLYEPYEVFRNKFQQHIDKSIDYNTLAHLTLKEWQNDKIQSVIQKLSELIGEIGSDIKKSVQNTPLDYYAPYIGVNSGLEVILDKFKK